MNSQKKKNDNGIWQRRQLPNEIIMKLIGNAHRAPSAIVRNPRVGKIPKGSSWPRIYRKSSSSICLEIQLKNLKELGSMIYKRWFIMISMAIQVVVCKQHKIHIGT